MDCCRCCAASRAPSSRDSLSARRAKPPRSGSDSAIASQRVGRPVLDFAHMPLASNDAVDCEATRMSVNVCPTDRVQAPVEVVWELLMHPAGYGGFWQMTVERVEPEGPAAVGQRIFAWMLCRRLRIDGEILEVDAVRHAIRFH